MAEADQIQDLEAWRASLDAELRRADGPLTLVGHFWLQDGINTIGSSRDCTLCLPKPAPRLIGAFDYDGRQLRFRADIGQVAEIDGVRADPGVSAKLRTESSPSRVTFGEITMVPVLYGGKLGVQVRDRSRPGVATFPARNWYTVDARFAIDATYTPYPAPVKLTMPDTVGGQQVGYAQGYVGFKLDGKGHNLDATESEDGRLFLQFRDRTNGTDTYSQGRFLFTNVVSEDGTVRVDFNRAFNPVAAFTAHLPSTVPPTNHVLNCRMEAGERLPSTPPEWA